MNLIRKVAYERNIKTANEARTKFLERYSIYTNPWVKHYLDRKLAKWSIAHAPRSFFGLSITTSPLEKLNGMIKARVPAATTIPKVITKIEELACEWQKKPIKVEKSALVRVFGDGRLMGLQKRLGSKVFLRYLKYYIKSLEYEVMREDKSQDPPVYRI